MRIALAQYALGTDIDTNLDRALSFISDAAEEGAQLVLFPELCLSPFFPQYPAKNVDRYAVSIGDHCIRRLQATCRSFELAASPNIYLREDGRCFDASLMINSKGDIQGISKMVHVAQVPGFYEQDYYTPSDTGFQVYDTPLGRVGIVVCFDRHYPESIRTCVLQGATSILIPTANTMDEPRDVFECELRAAALQNGVYVAMCNRVSKEGEVVFCGESLIVDPFGAIVAKGSADEELLTADIDLLTVTNAREKRPYLSLRRPEAYKLSL